ncbi:hypothetical protein ECA02_18530 [Enterococcus casseliflavus]|nr:hypothetical protein ECA02_18530 [Enterococcus casseliflavus]
MSVTKNSTSFGLVHPKKYLVNRGNLRVGKTSINFPVSPSAQIKLILSSIEPFNKIFLLL